ncbi:MAG: SMC-Scp complex subunit ScpB [Holophagales bacterium]|nr:SMC-Scp complex subunit ScpB [Holophagales bacterium]MYH27084.1 SMC-Scp complex subunit ScpB [Holophagales bacterium]
MTDQTEMAAVFEALLFASPDPQPEAKLLEVFPEDSREQAREALQTVLDRYRADESGARPERGVVVDQAGGGYRLVTRPDLHSYLRRYFDVAGRSKLSMAALETLAIVAYRQPVTSPEIQDLRGRNSAGVLKTLLERRLIRIAGRKEVVGSPFLYATTRDFLLHFGLRSLSELPPLEEFEETFLAAAEEEVPQVELTLAPADSGDG